MKSAKDSSLENPGNIVNVFTWCYVKDPDPLSPAKTTLQSHGTYFFNVRSHGIITSCVLGKSVFLFCIIWAKFWGIYAQKNVRMWSFFWSAFSVLRLNTGKYVPELGIRNLVKLYITSPPGRYKNSLCMLGNFLPVGLSTTFEYANFPRKKNVRKFPPPLSSTWKWFIHIITSWWSPW